MKTRTTKSGAIIATREPKLDAILKKVRVRCWEPKIEEHDGRTTISWKIKTTTYTISFDGAGLPYHARFDDCRRRYSGEMSLGTGGWMCAPRERWYASQMSRWFSFEKMMGMKVFEDEKYIKEPEPGPIPIKKLFE